MKKNYSIWIYPWDLQDEGISEVLDRLEGANITGVNVTTNYHTGKFFLPHNPKKKLYLPFPGALYFNPDKKWYGEIKIKPPVSSLASDNFWQKLREETSKRAMDLSTWTLALHNTNLGFSYPETNVVNAFGDKHPFALCAANDDIREYILALVDDLSGNYQFDNILLESLEYMPFGHGYHHEVTGVPLSAVAGFLMSLSFSSAMCSKAQQAGIDIDAVRDFIVKQCSQEFSNPYETQLNYTWDELYASLDGEFGRYLTFRESLLTSLIKEVNKIVRKNSSARISTSDFGPLSSMGVNNTSWSSGMNLTEWAPYLDEVHPTFYFTEMDIFKEKATEYFRIINRTGADLEIVPAIRAILPQLTSRNVLKNQIAILKEKSDGFSFYNYGFMPYQTLDWISDEISSL